MAAAKGRGLRLSADDVWHLANEDPIKSAAYEGWLEEMGCVHDYDENEKCRHCGSYYVVHGNVFCHVLVQKAGDPPWTRLTKSTS